MLASNNLVSFNDDVSALERVKHFITHHDVTELTTEELSQFEGMVYFLGASSPKNRLFCKIVMYY